MGKNFVSNSDAQELMQAIEQKKLTVSDTMPAASPALLGNTRLYIGSDTASLSKGGVYQCQALEVTPAGSENPQSEGWYIYNSVDDEYELTTDTTVVAGTTYYTIEWKNISRAEVDLSHYKKIWGGSTAAWEQLTDAEKEEYDYEFFDDDSSDVFAVVNAVTKGDMHPVTSNAVAEADEAIDAEISDIVNFYGAKNLLAYPYFDGDTKTSGGVSYVASADGSVVVSSTSAASADSYYKFSPSSINNPAKYEDYGLKAGKKYIFSGGISSDVKVKFRFCDSSDVVIDEIVSTDNELTYTIPANYSYCVAFIMVPNGKTVNPAVTVKAMIRPASIKDNTWEPYVETNDQLTKNKISYQANGIIGSKNLWDIESVHSTGGNGGGSASYSDGVITVNCPAVLNSGAYITGSQLRSNFTNLNNIPIIISFDVKGDSSFNATVGPEVGGTAEAVLLSTSYMHKEYLFNGAEDIKTLIFYTQDATQTHTITVTNFMLRIATDNDSTYQSYAMTNRELTEEVKATYQFDEPTAVSGPITINKTFTITEPGVYLCYGQTNPYAAELSLAMKISKNGTEIKRASNLNQAANVYSPISCATITECKTGDTINFYCENAVQTLLYNALFVVKIGKV